MSTNEELSKRLEESQLINGILLDTAKSQKKIIKEFKVILITLIICFTLFCSVAVVGFFWYQSQFETVTTETVEVRTESENANAILNEVEGNQYNDNAVHNHKEGDK